MKIAVVVLVLCAAVLGALWTKFVHAPAPEVVCDRIIEVTVREAGEESLGDQARERLIEHLHAQCVSHKRDKIQLRGKIVYAQYARCVMQAASLAEIERC